MHGLPSTYAYPPAYNYNGNMSYPYNWDQNTKEQMEAYSKLVLASYQNNQQQFCQSNNALQQYSQQQSPLNNGLNSPTNKQNTSQEGFQGAIANDSTKTDDTSTKDDHSPGSGTSTDPKTPVAQTSTMLPSPINNVNHNLNNSLSTPSSNPSTTPSDNIPGVVNNPQLYSPTNSYGNWQANNFQYTAPENPYSAFYNHPNLGAATAMYNQGMAMQGQHPSYFPPGSSAQQPDNTATPGNINRGWAPNLPNPTTPNYPFHTAAFVNPFSDSAAALYNNYATIWNTQHNPGQFVYGSTLHHPQGNTNPFVNNMASHMNEKMKDYCDNQQQQLQSSSSNTNQYPLKSFYNDHFNPPQHHDKSIPTSLAGGMDNSHLASESLYPSMNNSSNHQPLDIDLTYRNNPELAEKLRQVSLKKPRVTFSIKQVVELEKEFHSSR